LPALAEEALRPFVGGYDIRLTGPSQEIDRDGCVPAVLALHELATNAIKYGALSASGGHVELDWGEPAEGVVTLRWREHDGPPVARPERRGMGSRILSMQSPAATFDVAFPSDGVRAALDEGLAQLKGVPLLTVSAITGKGLDPLLAAAFEVREAWSRRVPTAALNRWFEHALEANPPPAPGGKRIKLRYITQSNTRPPRFVIFGNRLDDLPSSYERYLLNGIRRELGFGAVPVRLHARASRNPFDRDAAR
jgi:hypothetical protein